MMKTEPRVALTDAHIIGVGGALLSEIITVTGRIENTLNTFTVFLPLGGKQTLKRSF